MLRKNYLYCCLYLFDNKNGMIIIYIVYPLNVRNEYEALNGDFYRQFHRNLGAIPFTKSKILKYS